MFLLCGTIICIFILPLCFLDGLLTRCVFTPQKSWNCHGVVKPFLSYLKVKVSYVVMIIIRSFVQLSQEKRKIILFGNEIERIKVAAKLESMWFNTKIRVRNLGSFN